MMFLGLFYSVLRILVHLRPDKMLITPSVEKIKARKVKSDLKNHEDGLL